MNNIGSLEQKYDQSTERRLQQLEEMFKKREEEQQRQIDLLNQKIKYLESRDSLGTIVTRHLPQHKETYDKAMEQANKKLAHFKNKAIDSGCSVGKVGAKAVCLLVSKKLATEGAEAASKNLLKKIPIIGVVVGITLGIKRICDGDRWISVAGEFVSGAASCFPGVGTGISVCIDGALLCADIEDCISAGSSMPKKEYTFEFSTIKEAYACLGLFEEGDQEDSKEERKGDSSNREPTKTQVDRAFRELSGQFHPDKAAGLSKELQSEFDIFFKIIGNAKDRIYKHRNW